MPLSAYRPFALSEAQLAVRLDDIHLLASSGHYSNRPRSLPIQLANLGTHSLGILLRAVRQVLYVLYFIHYLIACKTDGGLLCSCLLLYFGRTRH